MSALARFCADVGLELQELKKLDVRVSKKALEVAKDEKAMAEYENMTTTECADLLMLLYP